MNKSVALELLIADLKKLPQSVVAWIKTDAKYWGIAFGSLISFLVVMEVLIPNQVKRVLAEVAFFDTEVEQPIEETPLERFVVSETPIEPAVLNTDTLTAPPAATIEQDAEFSDSSAALTNESVGTSSAKSPFGLGNFDLTSLGPGPTVKGPGSFVEGGKSGRDGRDGVITRRDARTIKDSLARDGGTIGSERAVAAAMHWLARHQNADGSWGCQGFTRQCGDPSCSAHAAKSGPDYPMAATAFGLLPYLACGQTHKTKGPFQPVIYNGLLWMSKNQDPQTGRLGGGNMYEHGLATIAVCEAYGLTKDVHLRRVAEGAVAYIVEAQNDSSGGWHYTANPSTVGDTSVVGWQLMGLKSAEMAGLPVSKATLEKSKKFLASVSKGKAGGLFSYMPESGPTPAMSAVGLLCNQYSGMKRNDPAMVEGMNYVMSNLAGAKTDSYFLYYATQVMHNLPGPEWDAWNRNARKHLIATQIKEGCAAGSWPASGHTAGPVMATSIHALTLEVYYRYLPLYQLDNKKQAMLLGE